MYHTKRFSALSTELSKQEQTKQGEVQAPQPSESMARHMLGSGYQNRRTPRSNTLADGHSYAMWPLPPQVSQMTVAMQLRLMCPGWPHMRHEMSRNGPPWISEARVLVFGQLRARCPETLQRLQTGSLLHSRAM